MFGLLKELLDRFIEFVVSKNKGETKEEQAVQALRVCMFIVPGLLMIVFSLSIKTWNLSNDMNNLETTLVGLESIFDPNADTNPLNKLIKTNESLTRKLGSITSEYITISKENQVLRDKLLEKEEATKNQ